MIPASRGRPLDCEGEFCSEANCSGNLVKKNDILKVCDHNLVRTSPSFNLRDCILKLYRNIAPRWRTEIKPDVIGKRIFSPYLTSTIAESVTKGSNKPVEIYTLFSAELFASKASSLKAIRRILVQGHLVFHLPDLHAKIVMVPDKFCSIGSQNLTNKGTSNKEISVGLVKPELIDSLADKIRPWLEERIPVSLEMVEEMAASLGTLEHDFSKLKKIANDADERVFEMEKTRLRKLEAAQRKLEAQQRLSRYLSNVSQLPKSGISALSTVREIVSTDWHRPPIISLVSAPGRDLTLWDIGREKLILDRGNRYLILLEDGNIGWARVMRTRISFVGNEVSMPEEEIGGVSCKITAFAENREESGFGNNVKFEILDLIENTKFHLYCWFDGNSIEIVEMKKVGANLSPGSFEIFNWIKENINSACVQLASIISSPFRYRNNLYGLDARQFFGPLNSSTELRVAKIDGNPILVGKRV